MRFWTGLLRCVFTRPAGRRTARRLVKTLKAQPRDTVLENIDSGYGYVVLRCGPMWIIDCVSDDAIDDAEFDVSTGSGVSTLLATRYVVIGNLIAVLEKALPVATDGDGWFDFTPDALLSLQDEIRFGTIFPSQDEIETLIERLDRATVAVESGEVR